jgi:predicted ester cyclase
MSEIIQIIEELHQAFTDRNLEKIASFWHEEISYLAPGLELKGKVARIAAEQAVLNALGQTHIQVERRLIAGNTVIEEDIMTGIHSGTLITPAGDLPATGKPIRLRYSQILDIEDKLIIQQHVYYDRLELLAQLQS